MSDPSTPSDTFESAAPSYGQFVGQEPVTADEPVVGDPTADTEPVSDAPEPEFSRPDASDANLVGHAAYVGVDPIYQNAANDTDAPSVGAVTAEEALAASITAERDRRDRHTGVTGYTSDRKLSE